MTSSNLPDSPVFADVEDYRQQALRDLADQVRDLKDLIASSEKGSETAALYMRLQNAIEMQGELMGVLKSGPPPTDVVRYEIVVSGATDGGDLDP
jgi:hypothetical protein